MCTWWLCLNFNEEDDDGDESIDQGDWHRQSFIDSEKILWKQTRSELFTSEKAQETCNQYILWQCIDKREKNNRLFWITMCFLWGISKDCIFSLWKNNWGRGPWADLNKLKLLSINPKLLQKRQRLWQKRHWTNIPQNSKPTSVHTCGLRGQPLKLSKKVQAT